MVFLPRSVWRDDANGAQFAAVRAWHRVRKCVRVVGFHDRSCNNANYTLCRRGLSIVLPILCVSANAAPHRLGMRSRVASIMVDSTMGGSTAATCAADVLPALHGEDLANTADASVVPASARNTSGMTGHSRASLQPRVRMRSRSHS